MIPKRYAYQESQLKETLKPGIRYEHKFVVPTSKTVPALYPESTEFVAMPEVFATGYLVGFLEWACIRAVNPHLDWPKEQTVGTHINVSHEAATPPGLEVTATVELIKVDLEYRWIHRKTPRTIEEYFADYAELARDVVNTHPDLILAVGARLALDFKMATTTIPIVTVTGDPIAMGLVASIGNCPGEC
jgi:predicted thioesterase